MMMKAPDHLDAPIGVSRDYPGTPRNANRMGKVGELLKQRLLAISQLMGPIADTTDSNGPTIVP